MHLLSPPPPPCQQPDVDLLAHRTGKDSERVRGPREGLHIDSHAYTKKNTHPDRLERPVHQSQRQEPAQENLLVICIPHGPCAHGLEVKDAIVFGGRSAYEASGEDRLADIGIGTEDLMHAEMLEE